MEDSVVGLIQQVTEVSERGIRDFGKHPVGMTFEEVQRVRADADACLGIRDWHRGLLAPVYEAVGWQKLLRIGLVLLEEYLPAFQAVHPRNRSYGSALQDIRSWIDGRQDGLLQPPVLQQYHAPGDIGFRWGIASLIRSANLSVEQTEVNWNVFDGVVTGAMSAWAGRAWGSAHPEQYAAFLGRHADAPVRFRRLYLNLPSDEARAEVLQGGDLYAPAVLQWYRTLRRLVSLLTDSMPSDP